MEKRDAMLEEETLARRWLFDEEFNVMEIGVDVDGVEVEIAMGAPEVSPPVSDPKSAPEERPPALLPAPEATTGTESEGLVWGTGTTVTAIGPLANVAALGECVASPPTPSESPLEIEPPEESPPSASLPEATPRASATNVAVPFVVGVRVASVCPSPFVSIKSGFVGMPFPVILISAVVLAVFVRTANVVLARSVSVLENCWMWKIMGVAAPEAEPPEGYTPEVSPPVSDWLSAPEETPRVGVIITFLVSEVPSSNMYVAPATWVTNVPGMFSSIAPVVVDMPV